MKFLKKILNKTNNMLEPVRASFWFTICSIINKCIQLITIPIFTRLLTTKEYGEYSIFVSWQSIIIIFATLNLYSNVFNNGMLKYKNDREGFLSALQGLTSTISLFIIGVFIILNDIIADYIGLPTYILIIMMIEIMLMPGYEFWSASERFEYRYKKIIKVTLLIAVLNPIIGFIFVHFANHKGHARILSVLIVQIIIYGYLYIRNFVNSKKFYDRRYWKYALFLAVPLVPHYLSQILLNQMDRIMISNICGIDKAGIYSVAYSAAMVLQIVGKAIQSSFTPWIYKKIDSGNINQIKPTVNVLVFIVAVLNFLFICMAPEVIMILGGEKYKQAIYIIPPLISSCYLIFIYSIFCIIEFYYEKNRAMTVVSVCGALTNYIMNFVFIRMFGYYAAGYTTLLSYIFFVVAHFFVMKKALTDNSINDNIFDMKFISIFTVIFIISSVTVTFIYDYYLLRYCLLVLTIVFCLMKKKNLRELASIRSGK